MQSHRQLRFTCVNRIRQFVKMLPKQWMAKSGFTPRASPTPQPMRSPCATIAQATILNWPSNSPSGLSKAKVLSRWAGSRDLGIFSQKRLLNPQFCWLEWLRPRIFNGCHTGYELEGALGWAVVAVAIGCVTIPCHDAHPKWSGVGFFEVPFLWEQSLRQGSLGGIPGSQQLGTAQVERKQVKWHASKLRWLGREPRCRWSRGG